MYRWKPGYHSPSGVDAGVAAACIEKLRKRYGVAVPQVLAKAAVAKRHPLHETLYSEDDAEWALRGRTDFCRRLIDSVEYRIERKGNGVDFWVRSFESVITEAGKRGFTHVSVVVKSQDYTEQVIAECLRNIAGLERKLEYLGFAEKAAVHISALREMTSKAGEGARPQA